MANFFADGSTRVGRNRFAGEVIPRNNSTTGGGGVEQPKKQFSSGPPATRSELIRGGPDREITQEVHLKSVPAIFLPPTKSVGIPQVLTVGAK